jgi:hypothetical protein
VQNAVWLRKGAPRLQRSLRRRRVQSLQRDFLVLADRAYVVHGTMGFVRPVYGVSVHLHLACQFTRRQETKGWPWTFINPLQCNLHHKATVGMGNLEILDTRSHPPFSTRASAPHRARNAQISRHFSTRTYTKACTNKQFSELTINNRQQSMEHNKLE